MLSNLNKDQIIAVAMVSFVYYHSDPMKLLMSPLKSCGTSDVVLWIDTEKGVVCTQPYSEVLLKQKSQLIKLPEFNIPVLEISKGFDLTELESRKKLTQSILNFLINHCWTNINVQNINISDDSIDFILANLSCPLTGTGKELLDRVIIPSLTEGINDRDLIH